MKMYVDVLISSQYENSGDFITALKSFGSGETGWRFLDEQSQVYAIRTGEPSCMILGVGTKYCSTIAITAKHSNKFYVSNIVPKETGQMPLAEYNDVAKEFARDLSEYADKHKLKIRVRITKEGVVLSQIISGTKTRKLFEKYMDNVVVRHHSSDIQRLDTFICHAFRYSKSNIDLDLLKSWLLEEMGWPEKEVLWCISRIETGLAILKVNKKF